MENTYNFIRKLHGSRPLGRPRSKWEKIFKWIARTHIFCTEESKGKVE
jgi:hypothetical protein